MAYQTSVGALALPPTPFSFQDALYGTPALMAAEPLQWRRPCPGVHDVAARTVAGTLEKIFD